MTRTTVEAILRAANCCNKDKQTRFAQSHVALSRGEVLDRVRIRATNAVVLVEMHVIDSELYDAIGEQTYLVSSDNREVLTLLLKRYKSMPGFPCENTGGQIKVGIQGLFTELVRSNPAYVVYPNTDVVKPMPPVRRLAIDVDQLSCLAKALASKTAKAIATLDLPENVLGPIRVRFEPGTNSGVIMPCHAEQPEVHA